MPPKKKATLGTSDPTTVDNNGNQPKKSTAKAASKKTQKKKYTIVTPVKQRSLFTLHEKKQFLRALKEEGFSVINTPEVLTKYITDRPVSEIRQMIALYTRKSEEQHRKDGEYSMEHSPLESWNSVFQGLLPSTIRKSDYSVSIIPQILEEIGAEYTSNVSTSDNLVNYGEIYKYLAEVMRGSYPPELGSTEAATVIAMMTTVQECMVPTSTGAEYKFLRDGSWWSSGEESDITNSQKEATNSNDESNAVNSTDIASNSLTAAQSSNESDSNESENIEVYLNLPKIKKISDCMNPLKVPVSLLKEQRQRLSLVTSLIESIHSSSATQMKATDMPQLALTL